MDSLRLPVPAGLQTAADSPFVGRTHELRQLSQIWDLVVSGRRQFVFVGGEPGAGKTRLVAELAAACHEDGAVVLLGSNTRDLGYALQPFVEILGQLAMQPSVFDELPGSTVDQLARISSRVSSRVGATPAGQWRDDPGEIFNAITELLRMVAAQQPVVLALDNLHWSGSQTRRMLTYLATRTADEQLLVVATHRTTAPDRSDDLTLAIAEMHGLSGVTRIDLPGLDAADIARYLVATSGLSDAEARRSAAVLRDQTGGNPFILEEARRDLQRQGSLPVTVRQVLRAPRSVSDMLEVRIRDMAPASAGVLERAAIVGDSIDAQLLVTDAVAIDEVLQALDDGVEFGLLTEGDDGTHVFRHSLTRQAFVARMPLAPPS